LLIGKARKAVVDKASNARALLDAVPESARNDAGYIFHKAQWLRREDKPIEAARLLQSAPRNASQLHNLDEWWTERRLVARKLLDLEEYQAAYVVARDALPPGTHQGVNDWKRTGWGGPCPPIGRHRYFFKLYALDVALGDLGALTKAKLEASMKGHIVAECQVMGTYEKKKA